MTTRVAKFFLVNQTKMGENTPKWEQKKQMTIKFTKMAIKIPNCHEMQQNPKFQISSPYKIYQS
jgi:hypothetical protein